MSTNLDETALYQLKDASLWFIIAMVIGAISFAKGILAIFSFILILIVALPKLKNAFNTFQQAGKQTGNGITGANIIPWGYLLVFIGGIIGFFGGFVNLGMAILGGILTFLGALFIFVAGILIGLTIYNLGKFYQSDLMWIGGILIIFPVLNFIGWILTYLSIDDIISRLRSPQLITPQPSVYQIGMGKLTPDGKAFITLNSSAFVQIISAVIDNTNIYANAMNITPQTLTPGTNNVTIQFPTPLQGFILNNTYTITLTLGNGSTIKVSVIFSS